MTVRFLSLAFAAEGWRGRQVAIALSPSPYWLMVDYALMLSGAVSVPLFTTLSRQNMRFQIEDADLHIVFTETESQRQILLEVNSSLRCIPLDCNGKGCYSLQDLILAGREIEKKSPRQFEVNLSRIGRDDLATIVYTSGTSGYPKGVELSHSNLLSQIQDTALMYQLDATKDRALSLLPLAHIFERMVMFFYLSSGISVYFADDVKKSGDLMRRVRPTVMTVVPRFLEKVAATMRYRALHSGVVQRFIARGAFYRAVHKASYTPKSWLDSLLDILVYRNLREVLGGNIRMFISGGAPLSQELCLFFLNIGVPVYQGYGLTEAGPVICANAPGANKIGSSGRHFPHSEVKMSEEGELLAKGPGIMIRYHKNPRASSEVFDDAGWLHTGDLATIDEEGYITITGRIKELAKTSTGEFISTDYIEHLLMASGWFDHVLIVGNKRPFVVALLKVDENALNTFVTRHGYENVKEVFQSRQLYKEINKLISKIDKKLNHWERIRGFHLITDPLTIADGDITPSMKLARGHIQERFHDEIEDLYRGHL